MSLIVVKDDSDKENEYEDSCEEEKNTGPADEDFVDLITSAINFLFRSVFSTHAALVLDSLKLYVWQSGIQLDFYQFSSPEQLYTYFIPREGTFPALTNGVGSMLISDKQHTPAALYLLNDNNYGIRFPLAQKHAYFNELRDVIASEERKKYFEDVFKNHPTARPADAHTVDYGEYYGSLEIREQDLMKDALYTKILDTLQQKALQ